jgi:RNA-directed DNA polymerase
LEGRHLNFVRYADDIVIFVGSLKAGERVLDSVSRWLRRKLKLQVNASKSGVQHPWGITHLGFSYSRVGGAVKLRVSRKALERFKARTRALTSRSQGRSLKQVIEKLNVYLRGWWGYYGRAEQHSAIQKVQCWIRRRLRSLVWKHWKTRKRRVQELLRRGVDAYWALLVGNARKGPWRMSGHGSVRQALPNALFDRLGLFQMG